jgi:CARDB
MPNRLQQASLALVSALAFAAPLTSIAAHAAGLPDLTPTSLSVQLSARNGGCRAAIQAIIANIGTEGALAYSNQFSVDGVLYTVAVPEGTDAGKASKSGISPEVDFGPHNVTVVADSANVVVESNELNNSLSTSFTCA